MTTDGPVVGILALQGDVRGHARLLGRLGVVARRVRTREELADVDALVIPGGESTTISRLALDLGLFEPLRDAVRGGLPTLGTCAGMIMLATEVVDGHPDQRSLGGLDIVVRRNAFGRQVESFEVAVDIIGLDGPAFPGVFIRAPSVLRAGPEVRILGTLPASVVGPKSSPGPDRIVAVRQGRVMATAFHPELTADPRLHRMFLGMVDEVRESSSVRALQVGNDQA